MIFYITTIYTYTDVPCSGVAPRCIMVILIIIFNVVNAADKKKKKKIEQSILIALN